ncbi:hypothetical protein [Singulisphaera acidiphila]|uniref:Uncharacterized protein n=1 Tax=Singulisphaera acidiphila (strain ATCC BAA-1392 / DSM 18658 / VKM B-2454 / MOB10) TaxID=886293 RepID=L0DNT6_SINAD|nr:hypothetical protein [Singulisphaera acidiphila]AGA30346.1 hypothetical protein Sinac_6253 [Singulisphaera acidiphila DSM 18658]
MKTVMLKHNDKFGEQPRSLSSSNSSNRNFQSARCHCSFYHLFRKRSNNATLPIRLLLIFSCLSIVNLAAVAPPEPGEAVATVFEKIKAFSDANISTARSVQLAGKIQLVREVIEGKPTHSPKNKHLSRQTPAAIAGSFTFIADRFGAVKRWDKHWDTKDVRFRGESKALNDNCVLDATNQSRGYIRPISEFLLPRSDNLDFYRDHWYEQNGETIDNFIQHMKKLPKSVVLSLTTNNVTISSSSNDAKTFEFKYSFTSTPEYFLTRVISPSNECHWTWDRDPEAGIWYPSSLRRVFTTRYPDGVTIRETVSFEVKERKFNIEIPASTFTFAGMGLRPGSTVIDMRSSTQEKYSFDPSSAVVNARVKGLIPMQPGQMNGNGGKGMARGKSRSYIYFMLANGLILFIVLGTLIARRWFQSKEPR